VISPWVKVEKGAEVRNSVIMHNCIIRQGASLDHVITDKFVEIGSGSIIGKDDAYLLEDSSEQNQSRITLIGKKACIPEHSVIGKGRIISPKL
jgi:glucose-1-phosphate adenylyltransferase